MQLTITKEIFMKKYKFTGETKEFNGIILKQIKRLSDGLIGGWIEKEENLSQEGKCFVYGDAKVYGDAQVFGNATVCDYAWVFDNAQVFGNAWILGNAQISGNAEVFDYAEVFGNAKVFGKARVHLDATVAGNTVLGNDVELITPENPIEEEKLLEVSNKTNDYESPSEITERIRNDKSFTGWRKKETPSYTFSKQNGMLMCTSSDADLVMKIKNKKE